MKTFIILLIPGIITLFVSCTPADKPAPSDNPANEKPATQTTQPEIGEPRNEQIAGLQNQITEDNTDHEAFFKLGKKYIEMGNHDLARNNLLSAIELDPLNPEYKITLANLYADGGRPSEAEKIFKEVLALDSKNTDALNSWGVMCYQVGITFQDDEKLFEAEEKYKAVIDIDPHNIKTLYNLGLLYSSNSELNDLEKAGEMFLEVHRLEPDRFTAIQHLAFIAYLTADWDNCRKFAEKGLELEENPELVFFTGKAAFEKKEYDKAKEIFENFLTMNYVGPYESDARAYLLEIKGIGKPED